MVDKNTTTKNVETNREQNIPTREKVYNFICEFIQQNSISPSIRDIAAGVGLNSPSTVTYHPSQGCKPQPHCRRQAHACGDRADL